ncbi:hypothetical protein [Kitasatospora sp. GP30]|uniref:hypothetical protein n=1 Tax=Kitasatospora sp. GP30 TaxID=3035084 RepID=UPI000C7115C9|nr:hypothetical protein [Kitasatospora sp. GP30]
MALASLLVGVMAGIAAPASAKTPAHSTRSAQRMDLTEVSATSIGPVVSGAAEVSLSDGQTISVPEAALKYIKVRPQTGAAPRNTVWGNCGSSWVYESGNEQSRGIWLEAGFSITIGSPIVEFIWSVQLTDGGGASYKNFHGTSPTSSYWNNEQYVYGLTPGPASAQVTAGSLVALANGDVCTNNTPSDNTVINP